MDSNQEKIKLSPITAILAYDSKFYEHIPVLMPPFAGFKDVLAADPVKTKDSGLENAFLQAGYFIFAARAVGLDAGPMGGFDRNKVDEAFFTGEKAPKWKSVMLINLGYGDESKVYPRNARLSFEDTCQFA